MKHPLKPSTEYSRNGQAGRWNQPCWYMPPLFGVCLFHPNANSDRLVLLDRAPGTPAHKYSALQVILAISRGMLEVHLESRAKEATSTKNLDGWLIYRRFSDQPAILKRLPRVGAGFSSRPSAHAMWLAQIGELYDWGNVNRSSNDEYFGECL